MSPRNVRRSRIRDPGRLMVIAVALSGIGAIALADQTKEAPAPDSAAPNVQGAPVKKFTHDQHAKLDKPVVSDKNCKDCHGADPKGALATPGKNGHQPCMASGCHVDDFLSVGEARENNAERYAKAASFCQGCHASATGDAPQNFEKAAADNVYKNHPAPEYHVELDHFAHAERKQGKCRDCHVVDAESNELVPNAPGHLECAQCHNGKTAPAMAECATCHGTPGANQYFTKTREGSDTRACGSEEHRKLAASRGKSPEQVPCFKHERKEHRFWSKNPDSSWAQGEALQCGHCHFMIADKSTWKSLGGEYSSVQQIKASPIMDNDRDRAHKRCGEVRACHRSEVDDSRGTGKCTMCHDQKLVDSLFQ